MYNPLSTYRIQFHSEFTFHDLQRQIAYLSELGTGTLYASPVFTAVPGSRHGYDVTNPQSINPEIGTEAEFESLFKELKAKNIGWMQDIVPNHMAFHINNIWLPDVLENGRESAFASFFDVDLDHPDFEGKLMVPVLNKSLDDSLQQGEIQLSLKNDTLFFSYYDILLPLNRESKSFIQTFEGTLPNVQTKILDLNCDLTLLKKLLKQQHYVLCPWNETDYRLNYRRFFTINELICLRMDNPKVFDAYHQLIKKQFSKGNIQGLRIDHIDGLLKPTAYLNDIRILLGDETYIVAEKILEKNESPEPHWPLQGTTGYDFMAMVNNLFTYRRKYGQLQQYYRQITSVEEDPENIIYEKKKQILTSSMQGDWENLFRHFTDGGFMDDDNPDITAESMKEAIGEFLLAFPRYKLYADHLPVNSREQELLRNTFAKASDRSPWLTESLDVLQRLFIDQLGFDEYKRNAALNLFLHCMQYTGPIMAKGVEDTAMYYYNCFIAHNEVGDNPSANGISIQEFHEAMVLRHKNTPLTMNATATHDTKRGEDVRARLNIISEISEKWISHTDLWLDINRKYKTHLNGNAVPDINEEYLIYQTIAGIFPFNCISDEVFITRMDQYLIKSLREAKIHSNWNRPNEAYEKAVLNFTHKLLQPESDFLKSFIPLVQQISNFGIVNSLSQLMLKSTCPGIPDFYQGTELWDFSLVDPDNRRPVDYELRESMLRDLQTSEASDPGRLFSDLYKNAQDGRIKLWYTNKLMLMRKVDPDFFIHATYIPLTVTGKYKENILAFARLYRNNWYIVVIPLFPAILFDGGHDKNGDHMDWKDTMILVPDIAPTEWCDLMHDHYLSGDGMLSVANILKYVCPMVFKGLTYDKRRKAGILLHVSSLPGKFGTGDMGPSAYNFIEYLANCGQRLWQVLPLNPTDGGCEYSPYSTSSAFAGNLKLISPEMLVESDLIPSESLASMKFTDASKADFRKAENFRLSLLNIAYTRYLEHTPRYLKTKLETFCNKEAFWLNDFALYQQLKIEFKGKPWFLWPKNIRNRQQEAIEKYEQKYREQIEKEKFYQFLFMEQWLMLLKQADIHGIKIIGDMPIYVSHDSAEVWQHAQFFKLSEEKQMLFMAGVPPDYFSKTGQLWNMPVYDWDAMQHDQFGWWCRRIRKNLEYCDIIRFDHFRGFSAYWEVPAGEKTAEKGAWTKAPGEALFKMIVAEFPSMPFIAEDLGVIDDDVYRLRDTFGLPGMSVLQFAFGDDLPTTIHAPHNYIHKNYVYTGTHDNNTIRGWFEHELSREHRKSADDYLNRSLRYTTVHEDFIRMAYASVADNVIIPIQDILGLDEDSRLNNPSTPGNNWTWKLRSKDLSGDEPLKIKRWMKLYGRM